MTHIGAVSVGSCTNVSYPGCEDCPGSEITSFMVEEYSAKRAAELGLIDQKSDAKPEGLCRIIDSISKPL